MKIDTKAVLITGASTGIGRATAEALARSKYIVFAGVRTQKDKEALKVLSPHIRGVILDVTKPEQIQSAYDEISKNDFASFDLVNNAGIAVFGPIETLPLEDFKRQFDINFFGLINVTQQFLPLIRKSPGRIVNISSISGVSSSPFLGAYSASKYALEAISDSLRWELSPSGIKVITIEPGPIATPIWQKGMSNDISLDKIIPKTHDQYYAKAVGKLLKVIKKLAAHAIPVSRVSDTIVKVLRVKNPPTRIVIASGAAKVQLRMTRILPTKMMDKAISKMLF